MPGTHQAYLTEQINSPFKFRNLVSVVKDEGVEPRGILKGTGLASKDRERSNTKVSLGKMVRVYDNPHSIDTDEATSRFCHFNFETVKCSKNGPSKGSGSCVLGVKCLKAEISDW